MSDRLRLFYTDASLIGDRTVRIEEAEAVHLARVLRMKAGERCRVATGAGAEYAVELTFVSPNAAEGRILESLPPRKPSPLSISLGLPLLKGERFDFVLQKGTELGADAFFPLPLARCEAGPPPAKRESRERRWRRICLEAAKQCDRVPPPALHPVSTLDDFLSATIDFPLKLFLWLGEGRVRLKEAIEKDRTGPFPLHTAALFGPEGDLAPEEAGAARAAGFLPLDLGPRVLRADTAPLALTAILQGFLGDMG